jgi:hypothetical protein
MAQNYIEIEDYLDIQIILLLQHYVQVILHFYL